MCTTRERALSTFQLPYTTFTITTCYVILQYYILNIYEYYNFSIVFFDDIFSASESFLAISNC